MTDGRRQELRLLVVSEAGFVGEALAKALEGDASVAAVACISAAETLSLQLPAQTDAVLVHAADRDGTDTVRRLREAAPHLPIIACAIRERDEDVVRWAEAGVTGYLPRNIKLAQIVPLVTDILGGEQICSSRVAAALFRRVAVMASAERGAQPDLPIRGLTRRERQIAGLIASGLGDKQIANELNISLATAKTHVHNLLGKLNVSQRGDVAGALLQHRSGPLDHGLRQTASPANVLN